MMGRAVSGALVLLALITSPHPPQPASVDLLLLNGQVLDGAGNPGLRADVGIAADKIVFVGNAASAGVKARESVDVSGLIVAPGFWDVHSHADLSSEAPPPGADMFLSTPSPAALPQLYQGITTVVLGVDGNGSHAVAAEFAQYHRNGIAVNAVRFVGHGAARAAVMGAADRMPSADEMQRMKDYVATGMKQGAVGLSTGLFYSPGYFAKTDEVVELAKVATAYGGVYDTHDRDLGATYKGVGYLESIRETIEIGERARIPVIFSHFNAQGVHNYGRAPEGAKLIESARARGLNVFAGQHVYTATSSTLSAYALPRWASVGGADEMRKRFADPQTRAVLIKEIAEMLEPRGGAAKLLFSDQGRKDLNGRTLAGVAVQWGMSPPEAVMRILERGNAGVMNLDLYEEGNTAYLAQKEWMMTCTDGGTPAFGEGIVHPRAYGAFPRKLRLYVYEQKLITLAFAIRGMTSLASAFYGYQNRGLIREGFYADLAIFDEQRFRDRATYDRPHQYSEGMVHVLVNGQFAFRNGAATGRMAGRPLPRGAR
jgi:N-acyl-D-amino-acid deacylase